MPIYEYFCEKCALKFEISKPIAKYDSDENCKICGKRSKKMISEINVVVKGDSHHKTADQVIGEDANKRWQNYYDKKSQKDKIRAETGTGALVKLPDGSYKAASKAVIEHRNKVGKEFSTALQDHRKERQKKGIPASDTLKPEE